MSIAKNALRQPVAISLISSQWKEKYNCAFHPRHSNQSTQNPLTIFKLAMLLVYLQSTSLQENCVHDSASTTSFRPCFCMSIAKNALRQPVAISLISNQWKEKYNCAFHPRHSNQSTQNPLLSSSLPCYWSTCNQYRSKRIVFMTQQAFLTSTCSSHQFPSLFLHVNSQEFPQTARRNQSHQQSVEGEVQLRFSSQAFQPIHSESTHSLQAYRVHEAASTTYTYSSHQFPSLFLHVKGQECPQTARRNQSHQQSVEGEVQLRFSSQAFQPIHSLSLFSSFSSLPCYWSTCNQYRSKSISFTKCKVLGFSTGFKNKEEGHQDTGPHVLFFFMRLWSY